MEPFLFTTGLIVILLLIAGVWIAYREKKEALEKHHEKKRSRNEYRTNEEFSSEFQ